MRPVSIHSAWWRWPGGWSDANFSLSHMVHLAQTLERGCFDAFFMADHQALLNMPMTALQRSARVTSFVDHRSLDSNRRPAIHLPLGGEGRAQRGWG
jgi:hypothetical protein